MRDDLRLCQLLRREMDHLTRHRLSTAERILRHSRCSDILVLVMNVVCVRDVGDIRDVGHVADIGDVHYVQVIAAVVIPGEKGFARPQRKPANQADPDANRKSWATQERN
jgi:hypothetical protein